MQPALLLDRDGVINVDRTFVHRIVDFVWQPGIFELVRTASCRGMATVVVTNQSGIGRGDYSLSDFDAVNSYMCAAFEAQGTPITAVYYCPYHPNAEAERYRAADHPWRKPRPGMILAAQHDLKLDLARSILFGDRWSDVEAGAAAGVGTLAIVGPRCWDRDHYDAAPVLRFASVQQASDWFAVSAEVAA